MTVARLRWLALLVGLLAGALLALYATTGPAIAFFSGGLFLDVQVESPAQLVARGAAVNVPLELTCNATGNAIVDMRVTQKSGSGVAEGFASTKVGCTGSGQQVTILVPAAAVTPGRGGAHAGGGERTGLDQAMSPRHSSACSP